jgi:uncharacterized protein YqgC (DUF456 family)
MPAQIGNFALNIVLLAVMLFGLFSLVIPMMPGLSIIWVAVVAYAVINGLTWGTGAIFFVITLLMVVGGFVDNFLMGAGAKKTGASWLSIGAAVVAGMLGSIFWPPFGGLVLGLAAIFAVEWVRARNLRQALISTRGMAMGCGAALVVRFAMGVVMIVLWGVWLFIAVK